MRLYFLKNEQYPSKTVYLEITFYTQHISLLEDELRCTAKFLKDKKRGTR